MGAKAPGWIWSWLCGKRWARRFAIGRGKIRAWSAKELGARASCPPNQAAKMPPSEDSRRWGTTLGEGVMQSAWKYFSGLVGSAIVLGAGMSLTGCARPPMEAPPMAPPSIQVSYPVEQEVSDYVDFTGRTAAVDSVEIRARVWGYLDKVNFKEGALVKKGDLLFQIDPRTYQAALNQAEGNLASMEARLKRQEADFTRAQRLIKNSALSREDYDKIEGDREES